MARTIGSIPHGRRTVVAACSLALLALAGQDAEARFGEFDPSFNRLGLVIPATGATGPSAGRLEAVTARPDGRAVAAGWATDGALAEGVVVQLTTAGAGDAGFGTSGFRRLVGTSMATRLHGIALDASGRVLVAGDQQTGANAPIPIARRLTATGDVDPSFAGAIAAVPGEARAIEPLAGGTTLVTGWRVPAVGAPEDVFVARLTAAGQLDGAFGAGGFADELPIGPSARAAAMAVDGAGRIVVAGWATDAGARRPLLARFLPTGALDLGFGTRGLVLPLGAGAGELRAVRIDGAGRIVAAGLSGSSPFVTRRLADGDPDGAFGAGGSLLTAPGGAAELNGLALAGDRPFVAGATRPASGPDGLLLGALGPSGAPDPGFGGSPPGWRATPLAGLSTEALAIAPGPDGTLYTVAQIVDGGSPLVARTLPNAAPAAALVAPSSAVVGAVVAFDAGGSSDPEGEALRYAFDLDGDGTFELDRGASPVATRSFAGPGAHTVGVRVTDPRGAAAIATRSLAIGAVAAPRPLLGKQGVARPLSGIVRYRLPGRRRFERLLELTEIPNGTEIDARKGRVLLTVLHDAGGRLDQARFYGGRFVFRQGKGRKPITSLRLTGGSFAGCGAKAAAGRAATASRSAGKRRKRVRRLWGDGKGRFRTRGRYGAATVRGTKWLTQDRCDGTLVRVVHGKVRVEGAGRNTARARLVGAGERRLVRAKRGG